MFINVNNVNAIVLAINNAALGDIRASTDTNGNLVLSSVSGADIEVITVVILTYLDKDVNGTVSQWCTRWTTTDAFIIGCCYFICSGDITLYPQPILIVRLVLLVLVLELLLV